MPNETTKQETVKSYSKIMHTVLEMTSNELLYVNQWISEHDEEKFFSRSDEATMLFKSDVIKLRDISQALINSIEERERLNHN